MKKSLKKWCRNVILPAAASVKGGPGLRMAIICSIVFLLCLALSGCGPSWKRKFVRKRAPQEAEPVFVYQPQDYQKEPNIERYQKHFVFWKSWHEELISELGNNRAGDIRAFEEALKDLSGMKGCLNDAKAAELDIYIGKLAGFFDSYKSGDLDIVRSHQMRDDLDRLMLRMDKLFRFSKVRDSIK
jgi:hypothetical protein